MRYQYKREPLTQDEANRLANACQTHAEKLVVWTLLDTGLRVAELATLTKDNLDWCCQLVEWLVQLPSGMRYSWA
jgi:integrase/recombinase XerD